MLPNFLELNLIFILLSLIILNLIVLYFRNNISKLLNILDFPNERKIHTIPTPLVGGICLFITILISTTIIFFEETISLNKYLVLILLCLIFFIIGLWDDSKTISPKIRTFVLIASLIFIIPFENDFIVKNLIFKSVHTNINLGSFSLLFTFFCIFSLYNALNFIDGYNGSATSIIIFWTIILLIYNPNFLYFTLAINLIIIFFYNLKGKIFLGNSGTSISSIFFGLFFINDYNKYGLIYADEILLIMLFPGIDMIRVTFERIFNGKKIYNADNTHFHHYLIKKKNKYIWQLMFAFTVCPILIFNMTFNIYLTIILEIVTYFGFLFILRKNQDG